MTFKKLKAYSDEAVLFCRPLNPDLHVPGFFPFHCRSCIQDETHCSYLLMNVLSTESHHVCVLETNKEDARI